MPTVKLPHDWQILSGDAMYAMVWATAKPSPGIRLCELLNEMGRPTLAEIHIHRTHLPLLPAAWRTMAPAQPITRSTPSQLAWLRPYQREDVDFISKRTGVVLASDLGIGKTAIASATASVAYTLIVCPSSAIVVWEQECQRMGWTYKTLDHKAYREPLRNGDFNRVQALIVSYNLLPALAGSMTLGSKWQTQTLIADEAHQLTNKRVTWAQMFRMVHREKTILLTATPMRNRLRSLWGLLDCACPHAFGSEYDFRKYYCGATTGSFGLEDGEPTNQLELATRLTECVIKRTRSQVQIALPAHTRTVIDCAIPSCDLMDALEGLRGHSTAPRPAEAIRALGALRLAVGRAKARHALTQIDDLVDAHQRVILWVWHHEVAAILKEWGRPGVPVDVLLGDTHSRKRTEIVNEWRAGDHTTPRVLIASIGAAATAIALTTARLAVFVELDWTPMNLIQAEKRHYRFGNVFKDIQTSYIVSQVGVDRQMMKALLEKANASETALGEDGSLAQMRGLLAEEEPTSESIALRWLREGSAL